MVVIWRLTVGTLVLAAILFSAATTLAGPVLDWLGIGDGAPSYSPARYWAPAAARAYDKTCGPKISVYAPDRHPEIPPTCLLIQYRCPAVPAAATIVVPPTPPATSQFQYAGAFTPEGIPTGPKQ